MQGDEIDARLINGDGTDQFVSFPISFLDELSKAESTDNIILLLSQWLPRFIESDRSSINLSIDEQHMTAFVFKSNVAVPKKFPRFIDGTATGHSYRTKQLILTPDIQLPEITEFDFQALSETGLRCVMNAPLLVGGECFGTLNVAHNTPNFYGPKQARILQGLAFWVASNIRVHQHIEQLTRSEKEARRLALVAEQASDVIMILNNDWEIEWVNPAFEKTYGYLQSEVIGRNPEEFLPGAGTSFDTIKKIRRAMRHGQAVREELKLYSKAGEEIWVQINLNVILNEAGGREKIIAIQHDITALKQREAELLEAQDRANLAMNVLNQLGNPVVVKDRKLNFVMVNKAHAELFGKQADEMIGRSNAQNFPDKLSKLFDASDQVVMETGKLLEVDRVVTNAIGETRELITRKSRLETEDGNNYIVAVINDVTELKRNETELKEARLEAERSNRLKSEFLANMSHEIRTPLNGVLGMAQLLERTELNEDQKKYTEIICSSGISLLSIINDVLDISKVEAGLLDLEDESFDVKSLVKQAVDTVLGTVVEKGISINQEVVLEGSGEFMGDAKRIRQVLINLAGNAVKFTEEGEVVVFVTNDIGGGLRFEVRDTGPGVPEEQQLTIFERFRQMDGSSTRKHGGAGLGLAISADLIKLMGGEIGVDSQPGQGARFWFTLPLIASGKALEHAVGDLREIGLKAREYMPGEDKRILLTEDNDVNQRVVKAALQMEGGFIIEIATNGVEALERLEQQDFDLVLMDIQMPVMNGDEAIRQIRSSDKTYAGIPIIALTANAMNDACEKYLQMGANAYLSKPVNIEQLVECVKKHTAVDFKRVSIL